MSLDSHQGNFLAWPILDWQKLFQVLIFSEACINLACYKDIFFGFMMALVFIGQYLRGMAQPLNKKTIAKDCDGDQDCIQRFQFYQGQRSESLALGFFIVIICFILILLASNCRSVFYIKYNVLMRRLSSMKAPHYSPSNQDIKQKRRTSQRPVPLKQLVRLVPDQALLHSASLPDDYLHHKNKSEFLTVMSPANHDLSKETDTFDISEQNMLIFHNTGITQTQKKFGTQLKTRILDIINEKDAHYSIYAGLRRQTQAKRVSSFDYSSAMKQSTVSHKIHRYSSSSFQSLDMRPLSISPYSFHPEYQLEVGTSQKSAQEDYDPGIFDSSFQSQKGEKRKARKKAYDI